MTSPTIPLPPLVILAGGLSTRMGTPKNALTLHDQPILQRLLARLHWPATTLLILGKDQPHPPGADLFTYIAHDAIANNGPVQGLLTALTLAEKNFTSAIPLLFLPVDMPNIDTHHLEWLAEQSIINPEANGILLRQLPTADSDLPHAIQPFPSLFSTRVIPDLQNFLFNGHRAMHHLATLPHILTLTTPTEWPDQLWTNLNTPTDVQNFLSNKTAKDLALSTQDSSVDFAEPCETHVPITRWNGYEATQDTDHVASEEPLEIRVRGRSIAITMRTPGPSHHDEELVVGFLLTEGVIRTTTDIDHIEPCGKNAADNILNVRLAPLVHVDVDRLSRHIFTASSCGLCGKASIDAIANTHPPIDSALIIDAAILTRGVTRMREAQATFERTGGLHAAALFDQQGNLLVVREDVGRHNAVDKVIGHALLNQRDLSHCILLVSGRTSFEIMQKSVSAKIPVVAAVSAPSSLAVAFAQHMNQTLIGFLRDQRMNIYTHPHRITFHPR